MSTEKTNRLGLEKSPYLLQHAGNPVDWYPWGQEAFERATREDKPVFLSIGYSTCHWCHVMEKESFEDPEVAVLMNDVFVSIKVDREERPDLDHIYMAVCQLVTGGGGWPLTIVMTPDKKPFFAGTYFPKTSRFGKVGMVELIPRISEVWRTRRSEVKESTERIIQALDTQAETTGPAGDIDRDVLEKGYQELSQRFDKENGGFGTDPKFPTPHNFLFLLRYWKRKKEPHALHMVEKTLQAMRHGGIFDQVGFGFHRYATDRTWLVPHFEKMLYDQALLALAYLEAYQAAGSTLYAETAEQVFRYVMRDLADPSGAFYCAEDADSEGVEGKFYVWGERELRDVLGPEADLIVRAYNVQAEGNFSDEATGRKTGENILHPGRPLSEIAAELSMSQDAFRDVMKSAREKLFRTREKRVRPHRDDKILADWNGLMIAALARGARVLGNSSYSGAAEKAVAFVLRELVSPGGRLFHRFREGQAAIPANLDDYAFLVWGLTELYEATFEPGYLKRALDMNDVMLEHFWDEQKGGLFFTPDDGETLLVRKKEAYDGAVPSGNAVALGNLLRLARMTGRTDLEDRAVRIGRAFSSEIRKIPSAYTQFLAASEYALGSSQEVVVAGKPGAADTREMIRALEDGYFPHKVTLFRSSEENDPEIEAISEVARGKAAHGDQATAYVCMGESCKAPTTDLEEMLAAIDPARGSEP